MVDSMHIDITNFGRGIADDYIRGGVGECSMVKQFDTFTYPYRLQPLRGMTSSGEPTDTEISNIIVAGDGMYAVGEDPTNPGKGELYWREGFGATDYIKKFTTEQKSGVDNSESSPDFLVYYPEAGTVRTIYWAGTNKLVASDPNNGGSSSDTQTLTFSTIGQGIMHPKDKIMYFPYQTSTQSFIASKGNDATTFGALNTTAFEFPSQYRAYCLSHYGDYLAIPMTRPSGPTNSIVGLWNRDTTITTFSETIDWGGGSLRVLNNLHGALVGVSILSGESNSAAQDTDKIQIKVYAGGIEPVLIKELVATRTTATRPACVLSRRVNFVANDRLYFAATITNGDSDANYTGIFSVGKNKFGEWSVILERVATDDNSETGIIGAAMYGDYLSCIHSANGTITRTVNGNTLSNIYNATSVYESVVNPEMPGIDRRRRKRLKSVYITTLPLPADAQVIMKYRVDCLRSASWSTIFTESTDGTVRHEAVVDTNGAQFPEFENIEFRIESTDGAIITGYGYSYDYEDTQV